MNKKKILIIAPFAFGYTSYIKETLNKHDQVAANIIYIDGNHYQYKNIIQRVNNFICKVFFRVNLKKRYIIKVINEYGSQDTILIIRPDLLDDFVLRYIKKRTCNFIAFYFDSTQRLIRKQEIIKFFDKIFSFDKRDVEAFGFEFLTNYIFEESTKKEEINHVFFNISGNDDTYRFIQLVNLAEYLKRQGWSYNFISVDTKGKTPQNSSINVTNNILNVPQVSELIRRAKILVEFQRNDQTGLSFRVFESLGHQKKLITTNADVVNYDFYHPQNILVIDPENPEISEEFLHSSYFKIDESIIESYRIDTWVKRVFEL